MGSMTTIAAVVYALVTLAPGPADTDTEPDVAAASGARMRRYLGAM